MTLRLGVMWYKILWRICTTYTLRNTENFKTTTHTYFIIYILTFPATNIHIIILCYETLRQLFINQRTTLIYNCTQMFREKRV